MLNIIENSDVIQFIETVEDEKIKGLLIRMHSEYEEYTRVGTPEECKRYKDWCDSGVERRIGMYKKFL